MQAILENPSSFLKDIIEIYNVIRNLGTTALQHFPELIQELDRKFQTIDVFERKKAYFENSEKEVTGTIGISKLHLSSINRQKLSTLQAKLHAYDSQKYATPRGIDELREDFERAADQRIRFFHRRRDMAKVQRDLNIIKNYINPLYTKAADISPLLDDVAGEFSRKSDKHRPEMEGNGDKCLIF